MLYAYEFAWADPYRAATHNKGIMNGIDAVAVATGNDWRAIEAGAHAYAARDGAYRSLTTLGDRGRPPRRARSSCRWRCPPSGRSPSRIRACGSRSACSASRSARELGGIMAAVGLASNMAAMRALATEGIQKGHMALHARAVSHAAGARGDEAEAPARRRSSTDGEVKIERARELLRVTRRH